MIYNHGTFTSLFSTKKKRLHRGVNGIPSSLSYTYTRYSTFL
nr:MAG TPA: hypothetical protein [Caudoviricetes sp.]